MLGCYQPVGRARRSGVAVWPDMCGIADEIKRKGVLAVKKLLVLAVLALGGFLVWRKVQADRSELDLWTEATSADN